MRKVTMFAIVTLTLTLGLVAGAALGGVIAPAAAAPAPCGPAPHVAGGPAPRLRSATAPAPSATAHREERRTVYASGDHLWFSWRASMVRWLGGVPVASVREQGVARREGWWGEAVPESSTAPTHVAAQR